MGLEINYFESTNKEENNSFWLDFNQDALKEFCKLNDFGSVTAFRIKFDYLLEFNPSEADKIFNHFTAYYQKVKYLSYKELMFKFEEINKKKINIR